MARAAHYRNAMGILLVYDITNEQSFENIAEWLQNVEKHTTGKVRRCRR
jgi:Ras-related protein Rab-8A